MAGDYVAIEITDTGTGMSPDVLKRVLEPFFTTKDRGHGTGLGLSMVYGVVTQLGGGMHITSEPGQGTRVTLYLWRSRSDVQSQTMPELHVDAGPVAILLVDDEPNTQAMVAAFAAEAGHTVMVAANGADACTIVASDQTVGVIIADRSLPGMSGSDLIAHVRTLRPGLPALLISAAAYASAFALSGEIPVLAKPFSRTAFNSAIAAAVRAPQTASVIPMRRSSASDRKNA